MDEIVRNLYVGTIEDAGNQSMLRAHDIDTIVSLTYADPDGTVSQDIELQTFPMMDGPRNDPEEFDGAVTAAFESVQAGERVLVHCSAGASRSVGVAAVVVALVEDCDIERAFEVVSDARAVADPHDALRRRAKSALSERRA
ncbi:MULTISPECIES: dual specificity protein phosphatase family protein [Haloferax]|uniref:Protein phosphatase n=1 Tax=Haloferax marinum TaxID=2666143 RepID=A0A6A8GC90_9EURY|nr:MULTISPECIES: dual specificity protein phosphatase family protein [Haloferax]KAB1190763.1 protein phosphatase [Haloferax sp. CBA1150]MRW98302.1 protein phosphatase [Haloferax marinum]